MYRDYLRNACKEREECATSVTLICSFGATYLSCLRLICKSKYEIFEPRERDRKREKDSHYVKTGAAWFTIGERISNRLNSSYPNEGEISCAKRKREKERESQDEKPIVHS